MAFFDLFKKKTPTEKLEDRLLRTQLTCSCCNTTRNALDLYNQFYICPQCGKYLTIGARERINLVVDQDSFQPWYDVVEESNPLGQSEYLKKLKTAREKSGNSEAVLVGRAKLGGVDVVIGACDANFMM
ncbi:MAG: acetyl-CoA carboxylase carboxyl transferase subunit beta, partial [Clostridia bacterium]|nr:acetyl-CoA carboxylase carboxyl transferase subunit beta [Clostridia bacterium]